MANDWVRIYSTNQVHQAEIARSILEEHEIACVILNKRDSAYQTFGDVELYTVRDRVIEALNILKKHEL